MKTHTERSICTSMWADAFKSPDWTTNRQITGLGSGEHLVIKTSRPQQLHHKFPRHWTLITDWACCSSSAAIVTPNCLPSVNSHCLVLVLLWNIGHFLKLDWNGQSNNRNSFCKLVLFSFEQTAHVLIIIGYSRRRHAIATSLNVLERVDRGFFRFAIPEALHALSSELFLMTSVWLS